MTVYLGACGRIGVRLLESAPCTDGDPGAAGDDCACSQPGSLADTDGDGAPNCRDDCPMDADKSSPGVCGCGTAEIDTDADGAPDCMDGCPDDTNKTAAGTCGCGAAEVDLDADGVADCVDACVGKRDDELLCNGVDDDCDGNVDEGYVAAATRCGVGACTRSGVWACSNGRRADTCLPGVVAPGDDDSSCDGIDSDCDGRVDEGYVTTTSLCGVGPCAASGIKSCSAGQERDSCTARTPAVADDAAPPGNGVDDDCDGKVDEDIPPCDTTPITYLAGSYANIALPGRCHTVSVRLWGAGGGGAEISKTNGSIAGHGGSGGPGGYAAASVTITGPLVLYVGAAAANSCVGAGSVVGISTYNGGIGGTGVGADGADGTVPGGAGGRPTQASQGGRGYYGGAGGGGGNTGVGGGHGGGGGAASVFLMSGTAVAIAGGGGGGGGGASHTGDGNGGAGGSGCGGPGLVEGHFGGGGGGGGVCQGAATQAGSGTSPAFAGTLPEGVAAGGGMPCGTGGAGYAELTFGP